MDQLLKTRLTITEFFNLSIFGKQGVEESITFML